MRESRLPDSGSVEPTPPPLALVRGPDRTPDIAALASATGGRVGLRGVLADPGRTARPVRVWGAADAFRWDPEDSASPRWWPQGITSSADAGSQIAPEGLYAGRRVLLTSAYSRRVGDTDSRGARISVVDLSDPDHVRYEHILLVRARATADPPGVVLRPVHAHAGGLVWRGGHLHVAATMRGMHTFHLDDVVAAASPASDRLGPAPGAGIAAFGHRYLLPERVAFAGRALEGVRPFRHSFLSLARDPAGPELLAGEYGTQGAATRLVRYRLDGAGLPVTTVADTAVPLSLHEVGLARMQGAVDVGGRLHVVTSAGRHGRGSLWVGPVDGLTRHRWVLPAGPEDLCHWPGWPGEDRLWTQTEYPDRRTVLALDRSRFA